MCRVDGCFKPSAKYSHLCEYHRNVDRTHGHPLQKGVTKAELSPYIRAVKKYLAKRSGPHVQQVIDKDWGRVSREAELFLADSKRGAAQNVYQRRAMEIIDSVAKDYSAMEIAVVIMAMGYFYADQPRRWASDEGFQFQAGRMVRKMARGETDYSFHRHGTVAHSSPKRCPQSTMRHLWQLIQRTNFVDYGYKIAREAEKERNLQTKDRYSDLQEVLGTSAFAFKGAA